MSKMISLKGISKSGLQCLIGGLGFFLLTGCCSSWCAVFGPAVKSSCDLECTSAYDSSTAVERSSRRLDSATQGDISSPSTAPVVIRNIPGEYYSTILTAGPTLNFKSSDEEYGGGYGKHQPGVGIDIGVGTVLPFNMHWAVAPSVRITQKNASEKMEYSEPGGGMEFVDKYSYTYVGATLLAQYRINKQLSFVAGPEVNYLISSSVKNGGSSGTGEKESLNSSSQKVGLDILAGFKYEIPSSRGRSKWGLSLMYDHRVSRLNKKEDNGVAVPAYKMKSVSLGLSYFICGKCGASKKSAAAKK